MSKSGSRYGRRSNWFKIHCLLQEQQNQAVAAAAQGNRKTPPPPSALSMLGHPSYSMYQRPPCTKEELMLLGFEDYKHPPSASPSVSSPDSHNSDSSVEVGDRRSSMLRQGISRDSVPQFNKDIFLPLPFPGLSSLPVMPPPGFLPPSHLMFPGYHPALYAQHQGLLKPVIDSPPLHLNSSSSLANNNSRFVPNHNSKSTEELTKRYFLDAVLKSQQRSPITTTPSSMSNNNETTKIDEDDDSEELVVSMTPPRSPASCPPPSVSMMTVMTTTTPTTTTTAAVSAASAITTVGHIQENPIDLSMKSGGSSASSDGRQSRSLNGHGCNGIDSDISEDDEERCGRRSSSTAAIGSDCDDDEYVHEVKRIKLHGTTPLDLTTKV